MSADNAIFVIPTERGYVVAHGFMSPFCEGDPEGGQYCNYMRSKGRYFDKRENALVYAHDLAKEETVLEYGVCELADEWRHLPAETATRA